MWPTHPLDEVPEEERFCSLYLGGAGMIWGLHRLGRRLDLAAAIAATLDRYRTAPAGEEAEHPPSLLLGETGILAVAQAARRTGRRRAPPQRPGARQSRARDMGASVGLAGHDARRPGMRTRARVAGERGAALRALGPGSPTCGRTTCTAKSAHTSARDTGSPSNVHALRGFVDDDVLRARVTRLLTRTAHHEGGLVNWPPVDRPWSEQEPTIRVQWCHGAPGLITTLADLMPPDLAIAGGELTWRAGPLRKGPGLCHGTAGNGFAFLKLYELTGDPTLAGSRTPVRDARDRPGGARPAALRPRALHAVDRRHRRGRLS